MPNYKYYCRDSLSVTNWWQITLPKIYFIHFLTVHKDPALDEEVFYTLSIDGITKGEFNFMETRVVAPTTYDAIFVISVTVEAHGEMI